MNLYWRGRSLLRTLADTMVFVVLLVLVLAAARQAGVFEPESGRFTAIDGDSLRKGTVEYRLHAIDAPELDQSCETASARTYPCGQEARDALRRLLAGKTLDCAVSETDRYGRLVATCSSGSLDINAEMVRLGWAIAYRSHGLDYVRAEGEAHTARRGVWQGSFQNPEDWRRSRRGSLSRSGLGEDDIPPD